MAQKRTGRRAASMLSVLVVGVLLGSVMITPAIAHKEKGEKHKHIINMLLKKGFLTTATANALFLGKGARAADAELLDGTDGAAFERNCTAGTVLGLALIDGDAVAPALSTTGVSEGFSCFGTVQAKRNAIGDFEVWFGNQDTVAVDCGDGNLQVTVQEPDVGLGVADNETEDGTKCTVQVETWDLALAAPMDFDFYITMFRSPTNLAFSLDPIVIPGA